MSILISTALKGFLTTDNDNLLFFYTWSSWYLFWLKQITGKFYGNRFRDCTKTWIFAFSTPSLISSWKKERMRSKWAGECLTWRQESCRWHPESSRLDYRKYVNALCTRPFLHVNRYLSINFWHIHKNEYLLVITTVTTVSTNSTTSCGFCAIAPTTLPFLQMWPIIEFSFSWIKALAHAKLSAKHHDSQFPNPSSKEVGEMC